MREERRVARPGRARAPLLFSRSVANRPPAPREALVALDVNKMEGLTPGRQHFLAGAVRLAMKKWEPSGVQPGHADPTTTGAETLAALTAVLKGPNESSEHVDIGARLAGLNLAGLPPRAWPRTAKTDALATEIAKLKKRGYADPYVYVDLRTWLPQGAALKGGDSGRWREREFGWSEWHLAFDQYMVAGAATAQLSLGAALAHKQHVLQVRVPPHLAREPPRRVVLAPGRLPSMRMCRGGARNWGWSMTKSVGPRPVLAFRRPQRRRPPCVRCSRNWAELSAAGVPGFSVETAAACLDPAILRLAETELDATTRGEKPTGSSYMRGVWQQYREASSSSSGKGAKGAAKGGGKGGKGKGHKDSGKGDKRGAAPAPTTPKKRARSGEDAS